MKVGAHDEGAHVEVERQSDNEEHEHQHDWVQEVGRILQKWQRCANRATKQANISIDEQMAGAAAKRQECNEGERGVPS